MVSGGRRGVLSGRRGVSGGRRGIREFVGDFPGHNCVKSIVYYVFLTVHDVTFEVKMEVFGGWCGRSSREIPPTRKFPGNSGISRCTRGMFS